MTFTENDGSTRLAFAGKVGPFPDAGRFVLSPSPVGTLVQVTVESHGHGLGRLAEPLLVLVARRSTRQLVSRLQHELESGRGTSGLAGPAPT